MGTVNSASSGLSNLLQNLSTEAPQLGSILSQPNVQSALKNASPGDVVELSDEALQLQQVGSLFGSPTAAPSDPLWSSLSSGSTEANSDSILQAFGESLTTASSNAASSSAASTGTATSLADQLSNTQAQQLESLFGSAPTTDPLLNTVG